MDDPRRQEPARGRLRGGRQMIDGAYLRADSALDRGQAHVFRLLWFFLPDTSIARNPRFEQVLASRFFSDAGQQAVAYGALIAVVRGGGTALESALIGVAALIPPALFALYGGAVADQVPKRVALAVAYNVQALLCILVPILFGTDLRSVLFLIFAVNLLGQLSGPSESAVLPLVATEQQLASAASLVSLSSNVGTAFGTAVLAPILVRAFNEQAVFTASGLLLFLAASRVFDLPTGEPERRLDLRRRPRVNIRATVRWLAHERAVATMIFVAVLAGTASIVVQTLAPRYVQSVLGVDPADAVYVFAPTTLGLLAALVLTPLLVRWFGERPVALVGFAIITVVLFSLGIVEQIAGFVNPVNPLRIVDGLGVHIGDDLAAAGLLAILLGFGLALTQIAVQTYINRRVPLRYQGRTFALQSMLKNGATIVPLLTLGAAATVLGVRPVLILSPFALLASAVWLVNLSYSFRGQPAPGRLDVLTSYWEESGEPVSDLDAAARPPRAEGHHDREHHGR
jgi:Na+/melibiose symporter-like transporter